MKVSETSHIYFIERLLPWMEKAALALLLVTAIMMLGNVQGAQEILMISLSTVATVFFLNARISPKEGEQSGFRELLSRAILPKVLWIAASVATIGILFHLLGLPGSSDMLVIGGMALAIGTLSCGAFLASGGDDLWELYQPILLRVVPVLTITIYIVLTNPNAK